MVGPMEEKDQYQYLGNCPPPPSFNPTTVNWKQFRINVGLDEGYVASIKTDTEKERQGWYG